MEIEVSYKAQVWALQKDGMTYSSNTITGVDKKDIEKQVSKFNGVKGGFYLPVKIEYINMNAINAGIFDREIVEDQVDFGNLSEEEMKYLLKMSLPKPKVIVKDSIGLVAEFHRTFGHPIGFSPSLPPLDRTRKRIEWIREELKELEDAAYNDDIIGYADALADIQYFLDGAWLEVGLGSEKQAIMEEVHRSNMTKGHNSYNAAMNTIDKLPIVKTGSPNPQYRVEETEKGFFVVYRTSDNKVMKNINFEEPKLESIIWPE